MDIVENNHSVVKSNSYLIAINNIVDIYDEDYSLKSEEFNYLEIFPEYTEN